MKVIIEKGKNIIERTKRALEKLNPKLPPIGSLILIKPNLVEPYPKNSGTITRPELIEGIIQFLNPKIYKILIGESSGVFKTDLCFKKGGYLYLEKKYPVKLINFDKREFVKFRITSKYWNEIEIAKLAVEADYLISAPVLKEHEFAEVTLSLKNMMGILKPIGMPTKNYIHKELDYKIWTERLCDLLKIKMPNLAVIDGTTGMFGSHLNGKLKRFDLTIVSTNPIAADQIGAKILAHKKVYHIERIKEKFKI